MNIQQMHRILVAAVVLSIGISTSVYAESVKTPLGIFELELGVPTVDSAEKLFDSLDFQSACQAYLWALPTVGFEYVLLEQRNDLGAKNGDVVIYKGCRDVSRFFTANVTTPYIIGFMDLAEHGPMVLEVPAGACSGRPAAKWLICKERKSAGSSWGICRKRNGESLIIIN